MNPGSFDCFCPCGSRSSILRSPQSAVWRILRRELATCNAKSKTICAIWRVPCLTDAPFLTTNVAPRNTLLRDSVRRRPTWHSRNSAAIENYPFLFACYMSEFLIVALISIFWPLAAFCYGLIVFVAYAAEIAGYRVFRACCRSIARRMLWRACSPNARDFFLSLSRIMTTAAPACSLIRVCCLGCGALLALPAMHDDRACIVSIGREVS